MGMNKLIFVLILFSFTFCRDIDLNNLEPITGYASEDFVVKFQSYEATKKYIHFIITPNGGQISASFSFTDTTCKNERTQLAFQPYDNLNLFIKKEEMKDFDKGYICLKCIQGCNYKIEVKNEDFAEIQLGSHFRYHVNRGNVFMKFKLVVNTEPEIKDDTQFQIWAKGEKIISTDIYPAEMTEIEFDHGKTFVGRYDSKKDILFAITAKEGDFISIGSFFLEDGSPKNNLRINDLETFGTLNKDVNEICYKVDRPEGYGNFYFDGIIFKNNVKFYLKYGDSTTTPHEITDGILNEVATENQVKAGCSACFSYTDQSDKKEEVVLAFSFINYKTDIYGQLIHPPQIPGYIYRHRLIRGESALFQGMITNENAVEINYNMKELIGHSDMKFYKCSDFPNCRYEKSYSSSDVEDPNPSTSMTVKSFYLRDEKQITSISAFQPLLVVECNGGKISEGYESCYFETSIFTDEDRLFLEEKDSYSQYLLEYERDLYSIDLRTQQDKTKLYLDLILLNGDVNFEMETNVKANKYYLSNKIFYSINLRESNLKKKIINFSVTAYKKSFYIIQYQLVKDPQVDGLVNTIESGISYLESVSLGESDTFQKYIEIKNYLQYNKQPFLLNFHSYNCKFYVFRVNKDGTQDIGMEDNYGQDLIKPEEEFYMNETYRYEVIVQEKDTTVYNKQHCMLYVSGLQISQDSDYAISISENTPQYFKFTYDYPFIKYVFHLTDKNNLVVVNFNLIDKAKFTVNIFIGYKKDKQITEDIYRNGQIFLDKEFLSQCEDDEVCQIYITITIQITAQTEFKRVETTVSHINGSPIYLPKNTMTQDILINDVFKYYYVDVGKEEYGDIKIDYRRGSGSIYAAVANKTGVKESPRADWRGLYNFPLNDKESLVYETYLRKILFTSEDTKYCDNGCYILITVMSLTNPPIPEELNVANISSSKFSITPRIYPKEAEQLKLIPPIKATVNEFIIGNIYESDKEIYEFYTINLPFDSDFIIIDWQADGCYLFLSLDEEKPSFEKSDFSFIDTGKKTIQKIEKNQIKEILEKRGKVISTLKHLNINLGVYTKKIDTVYTSMYAFRLTMPPMIKPDPTSDERLAFNILHIRTDQKVQCKPEKGGTGNRCLFAVIFDIGDIGKSLLVYPKGDSENVIVDFYANMVDAEPIERNEIYNIISLYPDETAKYTSKKESYIYVDKIEKGKCLLLEAVVKEDDVNIEVLSTVFGNEEFVVPNPTSPQVYGLNLKEGQKSIKFSFQTTQDMMINIAAIHGEGYFQWDEEAESNKKFFISGFEDRLTLTSYTSNELYKLTTLRASAVDFPFAESDDKIFVFYLTYYPRAHRFNIDQVKEGRTTEFNYREVEFPVNFYSSISGDFIGVSFNFYNLFRNNSDIISSNEPILTIWGKVVNEMDITDSRMIARPLINSTDAKFGSFDGAFGTLILTKEDIEKYKFDDNVTKKFYFSVELNPNITLNITGASIEVTPLKALQTGGAQMYTPEHVYHNGKLTNSNTEYRFKLKTEPKNQYMAIEFSANSDLVGYAVGPSQDYKDNKDYKPEDCNIISRNGKTVISFKISEEILRTNNTMFFNVYLKTTNIDPKLGNYIFKYMNSKTKNYFEVFTIENDEVRYEIQQERDSTIQNYKLTFTPVLESLHLETNYYIKLVYKDTEIENEEKYTIAISESPGKYMQIDFVEYSEDNLTLTIQGVDKPVAYIKVLAKVKMECFYEYMLYQPVAVDSAESDPKGETFTLGETDDIQSLTYNKEKRQVIGDVEKAKKIQKYALNFANPETDIPSYIKIEVGTKKEQNPFVFFYPNDPTDPKNQDNRLQIAQEAIEKSVVMWIKKEQLIPNVNKVYIVVQCQSEESCGYVIKFSGYKAAQFDNTAFIYNYHVTKDNTKMSFRIKNEHKAFDIFNQILTIYATGSKMITISIKDCFNATCEPVAYSGGKIITTELLKHNYFDVNVEAESGDYISFGSKVSYNRGFSFENHLTPNRYPVTGNLVKGLFESECYILNLDKDPNRRYYISLMLYSGKCGLVYKEQNSQEIETTRKIITNGYYTDIYRPSNEYFLCVYLPKDDDKNEFNNVTYTIQLTEPTQMKQSGLFNIFAPQLSGFIYPRIIPAGTAVYFSGLYDPELGGEIIFNMNSIRGRPKMYIYKCQNYPMCNIDYDKVSSTEGIIAINEINRMNTWHHSHESNETGNPLSQTQYVMIVKCENIEKSSVDFCEFQTSIHENKEVVFLIEGQPYSQYLLKNGIESFLINFENYKNVKRIFVDTLVVSGDVHFDFFNIYKNETFNAHKYYAGNKIFYSISITPDIDIKKILIMIKSKLNSYFIIDYKIVHDEKEQLVTNIYSDANYLIPIDMADLSKPKEINIYNRNLLIGSNYFISFQSLNCKFIVEQKINNEYKLITSYGRYSQKIIQNTPDNLAMQVHTFRIRATEGDFTNYQGNFCMLYASGLELTQNSLEEKALLLGEAVPQKVKFEEGVNKISYIYPLMNKTKNIAIDLKMSNHAQFEMKISANGYNLDNITFTRDIIYYLNYEAFNTTCKENEVCPIVINIELKNKEDDDGTPPVLETVIRQIRNVPYYLPKDVAKRDFVSGEIKLFLYTDVGKYDQGYITCNFMRGSGTMYASIVEIGEISNTTEPDWRNYSFPYSVDTSLKYNFNEKKILFDSIDTAKCEHGCYILITLLNSAETESTDESKLYHLTVTTHIDRNGDNYIDGRSIAIEPEQYILGSFNDFDRINSKKMYDYYEIAIPYDCDYIEFDWQATTPKLLVNKGMKKPKIKEADFSFDKEKGDNVLQITKSKLGMDSIANLILTIGVYGEDIETIYGTKYSFRVHFFRSLNIHKVNSDQKTMCQPEKTPDKEYRCLFMVTYEFLQFFNDLMVYARSQSPSADIKMYGKYITKKEYDKGQDSALEEQIPNKGTTEFNKDKDRDFIFSTLGEDHKNLFISVISDEAKIIEFMSSFKTFEKTMTPNPTGCQVFSLSEREQYIDLYLPTTKGLFINFVSIYGHGKIKNLLDPDVEYTIRGRDDRLSLAVGNSNGPLLRITNANYKQNGTLTSEVEELGFGFIIEYSLRGYNDINYDELTFGKTSEISYAKSGFPIYYYAKVDKLDSNLFAHFTFHDILYEKDTDFSREIRTNDFEIDSTVVELKKIYPAISDSSLIPEPHQPMRFDYYDPAILTGQLSYLKDVYKETVSESDRPTFLFVMRQNNDTEKIQYKRIRMEMTLEKENADSIITEKMYQYGILFDKEHISSYKLNVDGTQGVMRIELSLGTTFIDYAISDKKGSKENMKGLELKKNPTKYGKETVTFKKPNVKFIYLNIFFKKDTINEVLLLMNSYAFKYINSPDEAQIKEYETVDKNEGIKVNKGNVNGEKLEYVDVSFSSIALPDNSKASVIYTLKVVEAIPNELKGENYDSFSIKFYEGVVKRQQFQKGTQNLSIRINNVDKGYHYAQVIAQIIDDNIIEYVGYKPAMNPDSKFHPKDGDTSQPDTDTPTSKKTDPVTTEKEPDAEGDNTSTIVIVAISVTFVIIVIVLVVIVLLFNRKNKDLLQQVQKISFSQSGAKSGNDEQMDVGLMNNNEEVDI